MIKLSDIEEIIFSAGEIIEGYFYSDIGSEKKKDDSPVTIADLETDRFLKNALLKLLPESGWLSEEQTDNEERISKEYVWIVDPLDGTKEFVNRIPELSITLALVKDQVPILGAVFNPITKEAGFSSIWENFYFKGFEKKEIPDNLKNASIIVSRTENKNGAFKKYENDLNFREVGSVAYKLLRIAAGADDFYLSFSPKSEWDICGGIALINHSGKIYKRFDGKENIFNQMDVRINTGSVAGNKKLVDEFFKKVEF